MGHFISSGTNRTVTGFDRFESHAREQVLSLNMEDVASNKPQLPPPVTVPGTIIMATTAAALPTASESVQAEKLPVLVPELTDVSIQDDTLQKLPLCSASEETASPPIENAKKPIDKPDTGEKDPSSLDKAIEMLPYATLRAPLRMAVARFNGRRKLREAERAARRREKLAEEAQQQATAQQISGLQVRQYSVPFANTHSLTCLRIKYLVVK
jgi:hypothetical protein